MVSTGKILATAMGKGTVINTAVSAPITLTINLCEKEVCANIEIWLKFLAETVTKGIRVKITTK